MSLYQVPTHYQGYVPILQLSLLSLQYIEQHMGTFSKEVARSLPVKNTTVFGTSITFHLSALNCTFVQMIVHSSIFVVLSGCDCVKFQNL